MAAPLLPKSSSQPSVSPGLHNLALASAFYFRAHDRDKARLLAAYITGRYAFHEVQEVHKGALQEVENVLNDPELEWNIPARRERAKQRAIDYLEAATREFRYGSDDQVALDELLRMIDIKDWEKIDLQELLSHLSN